MLRVVNSLLAVVYVLTILGTSVSVAAETVPPKLIFTEIKVRHDTVSLLDPDEFIELYNTSSDPVLLSEYSLEYFNVTNPSETQQPVQKLISNDMLAAGAYLVLAKTPSQITNSIQSPLSSLADTGGRLRLVTAEGTIVDEVAWTNAVSNATASSIYPSIVYQCNSSTTLCNSNKLQSITRQKDEHGAHVLVNPTWQLATISPTSSVLVPAPNTNQDPDIEEVPPTTPEPPSLPTVTCEGAIINEVLPNADGADGGKEFIELYNPTNEVISLVGCSLQIAGNNKIFALDQTLLPGEYRAFSDTQTGLTLPNTAGGKVWLLSPTEELQAIIYPGGLEDNVAWALIDSVWQQTYKPTPTGANTPMLLKPCEIGQERSAETGRCQNVVVTAASALTPCKAGQERNPETGRCRNTTTAVATLTPCKTGQERNPETNRCRNIASSNALAECPAGQERNPDTNRCRKSSTGETLAAVSDVQTKTSPKQPKWLLIGGAALLAIGYGLYEWRADIANWLHVLRSKFAR